MTTHYTYRIATINCVLSVTPSYPLAKAYMKEVGLESPQLAEELRIERGTRNDYGELTWEHYEYLTLPEANPGEKQPLS